MRVQGLFTIYYLMRLHDIGNFTYLTFSESVCLHGIAFSEGNFSVMRLKDILFLYTSKTLDLSDNSNCSNVQRSYALGIDNPIVSTGS